jgi:hypothetical protein
MLPATSDRVPRNTAPEVNERIRRQTLDELDHEWDIERAIEANAAGIALAGVAPGAFAHRRLLLLPGAGAEVVARRQRLEPSRRRCVR